jgi:NAD(P)-dependent dehydrogenase (short-subunit alcohol dehydrogenase family)
MDGDGGREGRRAAGAALPAEDLAACERVLKALRAHDADALRARPEHAMVLALASQLGDFLQRAQRVARRTRRAEARAHDAARLRDRARERTADAGAATRAGTSTAPSGSASDGAGAAPGLLRTARRCYCCKQPFRALHFFYESLCPPCAELNWRKRSQSADLSGRVALVTGARIKIGYQVALKLLRAGAFVLGTTRFPHDAARRFAREPDFATFRDRLELHGLDLRHLPDTERFARSACATLGRLDVLVNNAAQTVRRPRAFYAQLMPLESTPRAALPAELRAVLAPEEPPDARPRALPDGITPGGELAQDARARAAHRSAALSQLSLDPMDERFGPEYFPADTDDGHGQPLDLRARNSWNLRLHEVGLAELLEVHAVNALAPFLLTARLRELLLRAPAPARFVVNVSAVEGQFAARGKTSAHPHTNMAKAALNMLTRTAAREYARDGIYLSSVDTGWVTNEHPLPRARAMAASGFYTPLDEVDGAARVCDPVFAALNGEAPPRAGEFLKDYVPAAW